MRPPAMGMDTRKHQYHENCKQREKQGEEGGGGRLARGIASKSQDCALVTSAPGRTEGLSDAMQLAPM